MNECATGENNCGAGEVCVETIDAFTCDCREDYERINGNCRQKSGPETMGYVTLFESRFYLFSAFFLNLLGFPNMS